ncbi:MAG: DUF5674 family protein [Coriobacteriales bacterium]|jgi:hypothetical protein|nr:DUF5674 family protein [Coriobacteriales bacterium]
MREITTISVAELHEMSTAMFEPIVKGVVDVKRRIVVLDAGLHADEELYLLENGSDQSDLWGINLWPEKYGTCEFVEFDSMINLRPGQDNRSRGVENAATRQAICEIVAEKVSG